MEQISASLDGELTPEEEEALQAHLAECEDCRAAMALLRSMAKVMREDTVRPPEKLAEGTLYLFEQEKKNGRLSLKRWRFTAIAAVICLALFGVVKLAPWSGGSKSAAPMNGSYLMTIADEKLQATAAAAPAGMDMMIQAGGAEAAPQSAEAAAEEPTAQANSSPAAPAATAFRDTTGEKNAPAESAVNGAVETEPAAEEAEVDGYRSEFPGSAVFAASELPGYAVYSEMEGAANYYCVCFVYGPVPDTVRTNRECTPLDAPEGQERWLAPRSVCVSEGLLEQFSEIYYGDLLSQQGLVIGILDAEEDQWQP